MKSIRFVLFSVLERALLSLADLQKYIKRNDEGFYICFKNKRDILFNSSLIEICKNTELADFQTNIAMILAKNLNKTPQNLAKEIILAFEIQDLCTVTVAGPGFINFHLSKNFINKRLRKIFSDNRLGIEKVLKPKKVLIDFSGPNIAKEMHVGHLRSTIIGDSIANILEFSGYKVARINHIGDWGSQFALLLAYIQYKNIDSNNFSIADLEFFYTNAKNLLKKSKDFSSLVQKLLIKLQKKDKQVLDTWEKIRKESLHHCQIIYKFLKIKIFTQGESFYSKFLQDTVNKIQKALPFLNESGVKKTKEALGFFFDKNEAKHLKIDSETPFLIQKANGGFLYATTDLAALEYRLKQGFKKIIYVTDSRQKSHFVQVFAITKKLGQKKAISVPSNYELIHKGFGMILGNDGKPFKTREGNTIKLKNLLEEAETKAYNLLTTLSPDLTEKEKKSIAQEAGSGSVKYADLVHNISTDYKFNWDKMLNHEGNTAFYLLINHARTHSLERKMQKDKPNFSYKELKVSMTLSLKTKEEITLAKQIILLQDIWEELNKKLEPHILINYIYKLGQTFSSFWNACPIIKLKNQKLKYERLYLSYLVQKVMKFSLGILKIEALEKI